MKNPASLLLFLISVSSACAADELAVAHARTFRNLAAIDVRAAVDVLAGGSLPDRAGDLFARPLEAAAFFTHSWIFVQGGEAGSFAAGFYDVWTDGLLALRFERGPEGVRAAGLRLLEPGGGPPADAAEPGALELRLAAAQRAFRGAADELLAGKPAGPTGPTLLALRARLATRVERMRGALGPEAPPASAALKRAVLELLDEVQQAPAGAPPDPATAAVPGLEALLREPRAWRMRLTPVELTSRQDGTWVAALASSSDVDRLVIAIVDPRAAGRPVRSVALRDLAAGRAR